LRLSKSERDKIAREIVLKIQFDRILDRNRNSFYDSDIERVHLLTRKDLTNIEQQYQLKSEVVHHSNSCTSVESWISEMKERGGGFACTVQSSGYSVCKTF